jgi:hypothetical protein
MLAVVSRQLPRSMPADQYIDPGAVPAFVEAVDADPASNSFTSTALRFALKEGCSVLTTGS